jgi:hypothetical protein
VRQFRLLVAADKDMRKIAAHTMQHEMGHECPKTTALYTQLTGVTQLDVDQRINRLVSRLKLSLDGRCSVELATQAVTGRVFYGEVHAAA